MCWEPKSESMEKPPVLVDIETCGRSPFVGDLLLVGWCIPGETEPVVIEPPRAPWEQATETAEIRLLLADPERPVVSMTKYDARYLQLQGWEVTGPYHDIQVMAWVLNENQPLSLDMIARRYTGTVMDKRLSRSKGVVYFKMDSGGLVPLREIAKGHDEAWEQFVAYCHRDVAAEAKCYLSLLDKLEQTAWLDFFMEEEAPFTPVLLGMETAGMPVNLEDSEKLRQELEELTATLYPELVTQGNLPESFNLNSGTQMATYLYYPVAELKDSLSVGTWACEALKSCVAGEHEDCWATPDAECEGCGSEPHGDRSCCPDCTHLGGWHCIDMLPVGFAYDTIGREQVHGHWVFPGRNLPSHGMTPSGTRYSTSTPSLKANMAAYQDPWCVKLMEYRKYEKALTTYLRKYPEQAHEGRIYPRFNQTGTKTGRLSSSEPNMQNQPSHGDLGERMRSLFQGRLVVGDYSQLEPRLMGHFSEDPVLLDVYREERDIYLTTAAAIFGCRYEDVTDEQRGIAKVLILALGYGAGAQKVADILTINGYPTNVYVAEGYLVELKQLYRRFFAYREHVIRKVKVQGYVTTIGGRHRRLKAAFVDRKNWKNVGYGERQAVNAIIQGSAGDIVRRTMVHGQWDTRLTLLAQVHDELVWEWSGPDMPSEVDLARVGDTGAKAHGFDLRLPLVFEPHFGDSWFTAKEGLILPEDLEPEASIAFEEE